MYEGFSGQARRAVQLACQEAQRLGHDYVGTEHLLLGVLREGSDGVARLLASAHVTAEQAGREVEADLFPGLSGVSWDRLPLTPAARRALEHAREEANRLGHPVVGPEHLLVGALREADGTAAQALAPLGLTAEALRPELAKLSPPENRDWMVRAPQPGSLPPPADPSPRDLAVSLTDEVMPGGRKSEAITPAPPGRRPDLDSARIDLPVVEKQLRFFQFAVATLVGGLLGLLLDGTGGMVVGGMAGCLVAAARSLVLGGLAGGAAGIVCGWLYAPRFAPGYLLLGAMAGFLVGICLGDWRKLPAPPGSGVGPRRRFRGALPIEGMPATERFTFQAREALWFATEEARRFNHEYVGTEHILLGLLREGGVAARVLRGVGLGVGTVRRAVDRLVQPGPAAVVRGKLVLTPRTRTALEYAIDEARGEDKDVGTGHLLLGLLREQEGVASQVLLELLWPILGPAGRVEEIIARIKKRVHLAQGRDA